MKPILYILIYLLLFSCSEKPESVEFVPEKFHIDTVTVELNFTPRDIINYKDGFLCRVSPYHNDSLQLIYLNAKFEIDDEITKKLNFGLGNKSETIWTSGDTLFTICGLRNYDIRYRTNKNWIVLDTGSTNKQNYMHHEKNLPIYEDSEFKINSCCRGEFGGAIFFYDKKSKKTYSCRSTCISGIQKFNNSFYISSSLYSTSVIKIDNPRNLYEIKDEQQLTDCSWYDIYSDKPNDVEIKHPKGYDKRIATVLDTFDISILGSFELKNHLYWVYSDTKSAYIGYIKDNRLEAINTIYKKRMYFNEVRDLKHNSNILPIRSREMKGLIILAGNKIRIVEFKSNTPNRVDGREH
jgi:hypothetical protein